MKGFLKLLGWGAVLLVIASLFSTGGSETSNISPTTTIKPTTTSDVSGYGTVQDEAIADEVYESTESSPSNVVSDYSGLSNNNYYTNSAGNQVHSPAYSADGSAPDGATAECVDGTYSFSQSRRGTCSHHGGVARWL